jgi:hypothetical protein
MCHEFHFCWMTTTRISIFVVGNVIVLVALPRRWLRVLILVDDKHWIMLKEGIIVYRVSELGRERGEERWRIGVPRLRHALCDGRGETPPRHGDSGVGLTSWYSQMWVFGVCGERKRGGEKRKNGGGLRESRKVRTVRARKE